MAARGGPNALVLSRVRDACRKMTGGEELMMPLGRHAMPRWSTASALAMQRHHSLAQSGNLNECTFPPSYDTLRISSQKSHYAEGCCWSASTNPCRHVVETWLALGRRASRVSKAGYELTDRVSRASIPAIQYGISITCYVPVSSLYGISPSRTERNATSPLTSDLQSQP